MMATRKKTVTGCRVRRVPAQWTAGNRNLLSRGAGARSLVMMLVRVLKSWRDSPFLVLVDAMMAPGKSGDTVDAFPINTTFDK